MSTKPELAKVPSKEQQGIEQFDERALEPAAYMSDEERKAVERKLKWKLDARFSMCVSVVPSLSRGRRRPGGAALSGGSRGCCPSHFLAHSADSFSASCSLIVIYILNYIDVRL